MYRGSARVQYKDRIYRVHARQSVFMRSIAAECVEHIFQRGEVTEDYPIAVLFQANLQLRRCNGRPIHVVATENRGKQQVIVITAYEPTIDQLEPDMQSRRKHS